MERTAISTLVLILCSLLSTTAAGQDYPSLSTPPQVERTGQNDVAVIVGVEEYMFLTDIDGVTETVNDWEIFFEQGLGLSQVYTLYNERGTDDRIMESAERAAEDVGEGGTLWFVFIGHGAPTEDGEDGVLVGVDAQASTRSLESRGVRRTELVEILEGGEQAQTVVIIDACFSGQTSAGDALAEGMMVVVPDPQRLNDRFEPESSTIVMAAAEADQLAGPLPGLQRPAFSYVLLGALRGWASNDGEVTASEVMGYTRRQLRHLDHAQTPDLVGDAGTVLVRGARETDPQLGAAIRVALRGQESAPKVARSQVVDEPDAGQEDGVRADVEIPSWAPEIPEDYVWIPAGTFTQGSPEGEEGRFTREDPQREVEITRPFLLKETPVTQGEWKKLMGMHVSRFSRCGGDCPVERINWWDAIAYVNALSEEQGLTTCYEVSGCTGNPGSGTYKCHSVDFVGLECDGYRLPTEAEWEYAARAGTTASRYGSLDAIAWYGTERSTQPVKQKLPNAWGLFDMLGNVFEWTNDWYGEYQPDSQVDPKGPATGSHRVFRGCSWESQANRCRAASRLDVSPTHLSAGIGFRPARTLNP